jgi:hypothetical protein
MMCKHVQMNLVSKILGGSKCSGKSILQPTASVLSYEDNCNNNNGNTFESLIVVVFAKWISQQTIQWIVQKITAPRGRGGSELQVCLITDQLNQVGLNVTHLL